MEVLIDGVKYVQANPEPAGKSLSDALEVRFDSDAGDDLTVRQYLHALLSAVWNEGECFSGKRPFGNSGWEHELYEPLAKAGFIDLGKIDENGYFYGYTGEQRRAAHAYVLDLIAAAMFPSSER